MKVSISSRLPAKPEVVWDLVKRSSTHTYVAKGLMSFKPLSGLLPELWVEGKTEKLRILLFGAVPAWKHKITFVKISDEQKQLFTHESGGVVSMWNHLIEVAPSNSDGSVYRDVVEIKAGVFTFLIYFYAQIFYRHRQRRWIKLIKNQGVGI